MFRNLLRIFRKETVQDGSKSTKDAVLLIGYRFAGHCRNAETRAAGEREFFDGLRTTLTESKVFSLQHEAQLGVPAFPLLSCNGFVTGNVIPLKIMVEDQNDVVDRINTVLPSHVRVYDMIETSPDFKITDWDGAVCSCYIPTCLLNSSAKKYIGHRINEGTISKLHETSKQFCSLKDFGAFKIDKQTSDHDLITKFDILPCFHQNGCEYIQLVVGFKGLTVQEVQRVVGVSLAVARNDMEFEEVLECNRKVELPFFPRLMLDEVQFDSYNQSLEGSKSYRPIDWSLLQGAQNEFKRKLFLPGMVEQDTTKTFWWNEFIFRPADLSSRQETKVSEINAKSDAQIGTAKVTDKTEYKMAERSSVQTGMMSSDQTIKVQENMVEEKMNKGTDKHEFEYNMNIDKEQQTTGSIEQKHDNRVDLLMIDEQGNTIKEMSSETESEGNALTLTFDGMMVKDQDIATMAEGENIKQAVVTQIETLKSDHKSKKIKTRSKKKLKTEIEEHEVQDGVFDETKTLVPAGSLIHSNENVKNKSESLTRNTNSITKLKERLAMNYDESNESEQDKINSSDVSSDIPQEFLTFAEASIHSFNVFLTAVDTDLIEGMKVQLDMREHRKSPVEMMEHNPGDIDQFWTFYKTLDQIELTASTFLGLCEDLSTLFMDKEVNKKLKGKRITYRRKKLEVSMKDVLSKLESCVQNIKVLKQGQDEIIDGMIEVSMNNKDNLNLKEDFDIADIIHDTDMDHQSIKKITSLENEMTYDEKNNLLANERLTHKERIISSTEEKKDIKKVNLQTSQKIIHNSETTNDTKIPLSNEKDETLYGSPIKTPDDCTDGENTRKKTSSIERFGAINEETVVLGNDKKTNDEEDNQKVKMMFDVKVDKIFDTVTTSSNQKNGIYKDLELAKSTIVKNEKDTKEKEQSCHQNSNKTINKEESSFINEKKPEKVHPKVNNETFKNKQEKDKEGGKHGKKKSLPKLEELF